MVFCLLLHISCHYIETLLPLANLSSCLVGNSYNAIKMFLSPGLSFLFDHLFDNDMPLIVVSLSLVLL